MRGTHKQPLCAIDAPEHIPTQKELNEIALAFDRWCERRGIRNVSPREFFRRQNFAGGAKRR